MSKNNQAGQYNNEDFKRIIDKANHRRRIEDKRLENETEKPPRETFRKPYSFLLFRSLRTTYLSIWWGIIGLSIPIPLLWICERVETIRYIAYILFAAAALRVIFHYINMLFNYLKYVDIFRKLPFRLEGWEDLTSSPNFVKFRFWRHGSIHFYLTKNHTVPEKVLNSLLYLFISEANSNFYETTDMPEPEEWKETPENRLTGDFNCRVAGAFYLFLVKELIPFQRKYHCIDKIEIHFENRYFRADPIETSSSEGTAA